MLPKIYVFLLIITLTGCLETSRPDHKNNLAIAAAPVEDTTSQVSDNVISLFGNELPPLKISNRKLRQTNRMILMYQQAFDTYPDSLSILMKYARALDEIGNRKQAEEVYSLGAEKFPRASEVFQYRGLNLIMLRSFEAAVKNLEMAVLLNRNISSTSDIYLDPNLSEGSKQFYSWYYLGLAYYYNRNYDSAISSFRKCIEITEKDDLIVMTYYWLYIMYQEIGNPKIASSFLKKIDTKMVIEKSKDYYRGLLLFKGVFKPGRLMQFTVDADDNIIYPVQAYALAIWYKLNERPIEGMELINRIVGTYRWNDYGYLAAEVDSYYVVNNLN
ncbi:MAG: tetratricopeptide repeat protein [Cyclobacteriaceae bacterium]